MSDHPPQHEQQLDDRIRTLVARAVADAPMAPDLALVPTEARAPRRPDRRPWWIVGTSLMGAAAAAIALILVDTAREETIAPAGSQPEILVPTPTEPTAATTTMLAPSTTAPAASETSAAATSLATPPAVEHRAALAVADGSGVVLLDQTGAELATIDQQWAIALPVGDGRVVGQERTGAGFGRWPTVATTPHIWAPDGTVRELFPVVGERAIALHDVAVVGGTPWLLYSVQNGDPTPDGQREDLHAVSLDGRAEVLSIGQIGAWEAGTQRLHLAANGLIVGESFSEAVSALLVLAVPGSPAEAWADALTTEALGLADSYPDCDDCPHAYTVDDAGAVVAWIERGELVTIPVADGVVGDQTQRPFGTDPQVVAHLDLLPTSEPSYAVSFFQAGDTPTQPAELVTTDGAPVTLPGSVAVWGPAGVAPRD